MKTALAPEAWSEDLLVQLLAPVYADSGAGPNEIEAAIREALAREGTLVPIGETGQGIRVTPGLKKRLGMC
jgi:hypothetical protein